MSELRVATPIYEGPIDLLLTMAQKQQIDLNQLRLADLTTDYLTAIRNPEREVEPEEMAVFLVVGSRLLALKAAALLPSAVSEEEEEDLEAWEERMRLRMQEYERFKAAAVNLLARHQDGGFSFTSAIEAEVVPSERLQISGSELASAFQAVLDRLPPPEEVAIELRHFSLADEVERIRGVVRGAGRVSFTALFERAETRVHAVVIFLGLLELVRLREIKLRQRQVFGEIEIESAA